MQITHQIQENLDSILVLLITYTAIQKHLVENV